MPAINFGALPPEVNSLRLYTGPGSAPMLAAMTAWDAVAAELRVSAAAYESAMSALISAGWLGPSSAAMVAAVAPYVTWLSVTGMQAEQTAGQAAGAAAAFEAAFAMTVPPAVVAANRARLLALVATNFLGINTPAIAATEAEYAEMWAQDATAMYAYASSAAEATALTPFTEPGQVTTEFGPANQAAAVSQAVNGLTQAGLQDLASPAAASPFDALPQSGPLVDLLNFLDGADGNPYGTFLNSSLVNGLVGAGYIAPGLITPAVTDSVADVDSVALGASSGATDAGAAGAAGAAEAVTESGAGTVTAGANQAGLVGRLSVPPSWTAVVDVADRGRIALGVSGLTASAGNPPGGAGTPGMPGMPVANAGARQWANGPRYGSRLIVMPRPVAAG